MEQEEEQQLIELPPGSGPIMSATVGRVMTTLLNTKPKRLQEAISQLRSPPKIGPIAASVEQSLWFLHKYVGEAADRGEPLDQVLLPIIQHALSLRGLKKVNQSLILLNWLYQDEVLFQVLSRNMAAVISRWDDRHVVLGWCFLGRSLIEFENVSVNAIIEKRDGLLKAFCSCATKLVSIICNGSNMQDGFELPTRLAVAAADFMISLTVALTEKNLPSNKLTQKKISSVQTLNLLSGSTNDGDEKPSRNASELSSSMELKLLLWNNLNELITLVKKLTAWSRKSRSLHAKGLERVLKWLHEIKNLYGGSQDETESQMVKDGSLLLFSCWKHYGMLMHIEDHRFSQQHKELLNQYLSGIQFYAEDQSEDPNNSRNSKSDTMIFFLNCLLLLLGRLENQQFGNTIEEFGSQISHVVMSQLRSADEEVIDGVISLFKAVLLRTNHTLSPRSLVNSRQMDALLPVLLNFLEERDTTAKAIVKLLAEYCVVCSDGNCLYEVLKQFGSSYAAQRRNAVDFVADLVQISSGAVNALSQAAWKDIANHLLECLEDDDQSVQNQAANLIPLIDPMLVLSTLVDLLYSTEECVQILASNTVMALLVNHKQKPEVVCLLLDRFSKISQDPDSGANTGKKEGVDVDKLLKLLSEWAKHVEDWHVIAGSLIDKLFAEPSNAVIVRFLSYISEYLADAMDVAFNRVIVYAREQKEIDDCSTEGKGKTDSNSNAMQREQCIFSRLCPLLVIRLLPLRVFDDLNSPVVYGEFLRNSDFHVEHVSFEANECIAALMINRAFSKTEFEDVRKLAAELCGRIHPEVLVPLLASQLESSAATKDVLRIKVCLFSLCTSLMVRGNSVYRHPDLVSIKKTISKVLSWNSVDENEISKAQHGCIDSLALMLCTELQAPEYSKGTAIRKGSTLAFVMDQLTSDKDYIFIKSEGDNTIPDSNTCIPFRLCMANVLISACKKIPETGKKSFTKKILPCVISAVGGMVEPEIRAACIQVLLTVAYHLKCFIYPYSNDLLGVVLKSLREGSPKEKLAGAKLLTCLMASEEEVVESITDRLLEAKALLHDLSRKDPSPDVRLMCKQLLTCFTSH